MSQEEAHNEFNNLVTRYLSGELSEQERQRFEEIIAENPDSRKMVEEYRKIWDSVGSMAGRDAYDLDAEWELLRGQIPDLSQKPGRTVLFYAYRVAAALVVGLIFTFGWIYATRVAGTELVVAGNEPVEVMLEDGTQVIINRDSRIRYNKQFIGPERKVRMSGEAWFDVARDTSRAFVIDAGVAVVQVLGTSFNVNAYRENEEVEITVESGVVALTAKQDQQEQIVLKAGNSGTLHRESRELELIPTSDPNNISWKTRELYFENTPLREVVEVINHAYNTRMEIMDPALEECPITVTFRNQSLDAILNVLEVTMDLEISRSGNRIILDGEGCDNAGGAQ